MRAALLRNSRLVRVMGQSLPFLTDGERVSFTPMCGRLRVGKDCFSRLQHWSVRPCVRPLIGAPIFGTLVPVEEVAVGTEITLRPPHRSRRALLHAPGSHLGW